MNKRIILSVLLVSSMLLSSCSMSSDRSRSRRDRDDDDEDQTERTELTEETEQTEPSEDLDQTRQTIEETEVTPSQNEITDEIRQAAYASYLSVLEANEESIRAYNWIDIASQWNNAGGLAMEGEYQCALYDVTGDGLEELFFMTSVNDVMATLDIYSYDTSASQAYSVLEVQGLDVQAGGGGYYFVALLNDGDMLVYVSSGDEQWTDAYRVLTFDGYEFQVSSSFEYTTRPNDDYTGSIDEYTSDRAEISADAYEGLVASALSDIDAVFQYNWISDDQIVEVLSSHPCYAISYDSAVAELTGSGSGTGSK